MYDYQYFMDVWDFFLFLVLFKNDSWSSQYWEKFTKASFALDDNDFILICRHELAP